MSQKPSIGRIVVYRSRTGAWDAPAIIAATQETLNRDLVEAGYCPDLSSPEHVHLVVFSPGVAMSPAQQDAAANFEPGPGGRDYNYGGTFREWDVPFDAVRDARVPAGTWRWPERV